MRGKIRTTDSTHTGHELHGKNSHRPHPKPLSNEAPRRSTLILTQHNNTKKSRVRIIELIRNKMATATWKPGDVELPLSSGRGYSVSSMKSEVLDGATLTSNVEDSASDNLNAHNNGNGRSVPEVLRKEYAVSTRWQLEMEERKRRRAESKSSNPFGCCLCFITGTCNMETVNNMFCCCSRRIGGMFSLVEKKDGTPIVIAGPCWPFCMFVTLPLILGITGLVTYFVVLNPNSKLVRVFLSLNVVLYLSDSHENLMYPPYYDPTYSQDGWPIYISLSW